MSDPTDNRKEFLLHLYDQLWNSINYRLSLIWESIGILVSAFAIFALTEKNIISLSIASSIMVLLSGWYLAHVIDMSFWFNRNIAMIVNIEREFLNVKDAKLIYGYFLSHRKNNRMVTYLQIQAMLGIGIGCIILLLHISQNIIPSIKGSIPFSIEMIIPYSLLIIVVIYLLRAKRGRDIEYNSFINESPGKDLSKKENN